MNDPAIRVRLVSKTYKVYKHPRHRLFEALLRGKRSFHRDFWALRDVSFDVRKGTTFGVIGMNGSGKSTLLQILAGVMEPTQGTVETHGRIASLLELGSGFNPEFTGRENIEMNGAIMGFNRREIAERLPKVEAFAEVGEFIDRPVKTYSTGMMVRIAFASAIEVNPDILIVDEALSVGDAVFQHRCIRRIKQFQDEGKTVVFVSHDIPAVKSICSEAVFLHGGEIKALGEVSEVANSYHAHIASVEARGGEVVGAIAHTREEPLYREDPDFDDKTQLFRHGDGRARVKNVEVLKADSSPVSAVVFGEETIFRVHIGFSSDVDPFIVGFILRDKNGADIVAANSHEEQVPMPSRRCGETLVVDFGLMLPLKPGTYSVTIALASKPDVPEYLDWVDNALVFELHPPASRKVIYSMVSLPVEIAVHV